MNNFLEQKIDLAIPLKCFVTSVKISETKGQKIISVHGFVDENSTNDVLIEFAII